MNAGWLRISGLDATGNINLVILAEHAQSKHAGNRGDAVVRKSDYEAGDSISSEGPDERRANTVADLASDLFDGLGKLFVVAENVGGRLLVPTPKRQIVNAHIRRVGNNLFVVSNSVFVNLEFFWIASGETNFTDCSGPGRTVAERLDLSVLNEDGVGTQPVSGTHGPIDKVGVANVAEVGLRVCSQWDSRPVFKLHFEHGRPSPL